MVHSTMLNLVQVARAWVSTRQQLRLDGIEFLSTLSSAMTLLRHHPAAVIWALQVRTARLMVVKLKFHQQAWCVTPAYD
jgi:hypothetical protein